MITRNVVSYDYGLKGKTSRDSERKSEPTDSEYGKSTNVVVSNVIKVKPTVTMNNPDNLNPSKSQLMK